MGLVDDEDPVEAFAAHGADESFADGVGFRGSERCLDDADVGSGEDVVEEVTHERDAAVAVGIPSKCGDIHYEEMS